MTDESRERAWRYVVGLSEKATIENVTERGNRSVFVGGIQTWVRMRERERERGMVVGMSISVRKMGRHSSSVELDR